MGFIGGSEFENHPATQLRDVAEVVGEPLPVILIRIAFPIRQRRRVCVIVHPIVSFNSPLGRTIFIRFRSRRQEVSQEKTKRPERPERQKRSWLLSGA
jgi:hypothetical protein